MVKIELRNYDTGGDPEPCFATDAEIALADRLRHQLEERYFGSLAAYSPMQDHSKEIH